MGVVRCSRCDRFIDLDYDCEVYTNDQIPFLCKDDSDWVCFDCLTDVEAERLEDDEILSLPVSIRESTCGNTTKYYAYDIMDRHKNVLFTVIDKDLANILVKKINSELYV